MEAVRLEPGAESVRVFKAALALTSQEPVDMGPVEDVYVILSQWKSRKLMDEWLKEANQNPLYDAFYNTTTGEEDTAAVVGYVSITSPYLVRTVELSGFINNP